MAMAINAVSRPTFCKEDELQNNRVWSMHKSSSTNRHWTVCVCTLKRLQQSDFLLTQYSVVFSQSTPCSFTTLALLKSQCYVTLLLLLISFTMHRKIMLYVQFTYLALMPPPGGKPSMSSVASMCMIYWSSPVSCGIPSIMSASTEQIQQSVHSFNMCHSMAIHY